MGWFKREGWRGRRVRLAVVLGVLGAVVACRDDVSPARVAGPASEAQVVSGPP
ncbi:MAG: hypothetical protein RL330_1371, partial [Actinomycetota bacterium]